MDKKELQGFTLIELMIVVAVIGILAAIAIPNYQESMRKSRRSDAEGALLNFANAMERHYTQNSSYCDAGGADGANSCFVGAAETGVNDTGTPPGNIFAAPGATAANYTFTIVAANASSFTLQATPRAGSAQAGNGALQLTSAGLRSWDRNNDGDFVDTNEASWEH